MQVIGFSWQDTHTALPFQFIGWELAWVRAICTSVTTFSSNDVSETFRAGRMWCCSCVVSICVNHGWLRRADI